MILKLIAVGILTLVSKIDDGAATPQISNYPMPERGKTQYQRPDKPDSFIQDPYQWMEKADSEETKKFIEEENRLTQEYFGKNSKLAEEIKSRYAELWAMEKFEGPNPQGDKFFSYRSTDADKQEILYVHDEPVGDGREFLDPNKLGTGSSVTLIKASSAFSQDGKVFAYLTTDSEAQTNFIQFKHLEKECIYKEKLRNVANNKVVWVKNEEIIYTTYDVLNGQSDKLAAPDYSTLRLYYHKLGREQKDDVLVGKLDNDENYHFSFVTTDDCKYLIVSVYHGFKNQVLIADLKLLKNLRRGNFLNFRPLLVKADAKYEFVTNINSKFIFLTNKDAPKYKLVSIDVENSNMWEDVVKENPSLVLDWAKPAGEKYMVLAYITPKINTELQLFEVATGSQKMTFELPDGAVKAELFYSDNKRNKIYINFQSFFVPCIVYEFDVNDLKSSESKKIKEITVPNFNAEDYVVDFQEVGNVDVDNRVVMIPTKIIHREKTQLFNNNFTFLTAHGGFGDKLLPYFSIHCIVVLKNLNGIYVITNIRGGGEKGEEWHINGSMDKKPNSMNDFLTVAQYLNEYNYTSPELLAVDGGNTGISGPLIGASIIEHPELFRVAIMEAGLTDMYRFDKLRPEWTYEYGSPKCAADIGYLMDYSPLHNVNINKIEYPATMVISAIDDERVPTFHSLKFIATLQNEARKNPIQEKPFIFKKAGNSKTTLEVAAEITLFIVMNTKAEFKL